MLFRSEEIRRKELERTVGRLRSLSPEEVQIIEGLTNTLVNKILHNPLVALKLEAHSTNGLLYAEAVRKLFDLDIKLVERGTGETTINDEENIENDNSNH